VSPAPKVSVLIPSYQYARYLPEAIESVLAQRFEDFELIVSDDASTDGTAEVLRGYAGRDTRMQVHVQPANLGMVAHWNWCLQRARGEYVKFVFGDDRLVSRGALGRMVAMLDEHPGCVLAASARLVLDEESRVTDEWNELGAAGRQDGRGVIARALWVDRNVIGEPSVVLFRRDAAARGFDPTLRQVVDLEMWFHLLRQGDLVFDPAPLCSFRRHPLQQTALNRAGQIGPLECLVLTVRYLDVLAADEASPWRRLALRRICHQRLYYSRKHSPRTPEVAALEAVLGQRVGRGWGPWFWAWHRLSKPWLNLARKVRAGGGRARARARARARPRPLAEFERE
jgi:glycosyltransferase involved in cell wall biosynthesis